MHEQVQSQLEDILQGGIRPGDRAEVERHLANCSDCAAELQVLRMCSGVVRSLRVAEVPDLGVGFYARVMERVEAQGRPSFWNLLLDPVFGQRLVYATGALFLLMASFLLATSGNQPELAQTPVQMMAQPATGGAHPMQAAFGDDVQRDREQFLVTLASFPE